MKPLAASILILSSLGFKSVYADQTQDAPQSRQLIQESGATGLSDHARQGRVSLGGALGFTLDPDTFLLAFNGDYFVNDNFALGPLLQLGVSGNRVLLAPTLNFRGVFDLRVRELKSLKPFVQGGFGLVSTLWDSMQAIVRQANSSLPKEEEITLTPHMLRHTRLRQLTRAKGVEWAKKHSGQVSDKYIWRYVNPSDDELEAAQEEMD